VFPCTKTVSGFNLWPGFVTCYLVLSNRKSQIKNELNNHEYVSNQINYHLKFTHLSFAFPWMDPYFCESRSIQFYGEIGARILLDLLT